MSSHDAVQVAETILKKSGQKPETAVILGSGLGGFADRLENRISIPYNEIPGMPEVTVAGHSGMVHVGKCGGRTVVAFGGRFHRYEGHPFEKTVFPVQVASALGAKLLLISNAAGGVTSRLSEGDLMLINDFIAPSTPVRMPGKPVPKRFDNRHIRHQILQTAADCGIHLQHGTYCYVSGPTYETKAEIRAYRTLGADVVGMSTMPEILEAVKLGLDCIGISLVTNMGTGVGSGKLDHSEVKDMAESRKDAFAHLVTELIRKLGSGFRA